MEFIADYYDDISDYSEIYSELVSQRNELIVWLQDFNLIHRNRFVQKSDAQEWAHHRSASARRRSFRVNISALLKRLYSHDSIEAFYDFESYDLSDWSDTEANRLERELNMLQVIIGKLEGRYDLQYKRFIIYAAQEQKLYINSKLILKTGQVTLRHRLLACLYSEPGILWENEMLEEYFINHFKYKEGELVDKIVEKCAYDIRKDVASKTGIQDYLLVSNSSVRVNAKYLPR